MENKWTIGRLKEEVQKYSSRSEFHDKCRNGYDFALENNFLDKYFPTEKKRRPTGFWNNYENCKLETSKYTILDDFRIKSSGCYDALLRNGWLEELTNHMIRKKKPNTHWTKELCTNIVSKFNDIKELTKEYPGCVNAIYSNGWGELLDKIRRVKKPWTYETAKEEVNKYELIVDIINNDSGLYGAIRKNKWDDLLEDKRGNYKPVSVYDKNKCHECALQCSSISEFSKKFSGAYQNCLKYGWLEEVCSHIKRIKRRNGYWNDENVIEEAKKYTTLKEFREKGHGAYYYASDRKELMNKIKTFLITDRKENGYWNYERCYEEAKKYKTLIDFHDKSSSAYNSAKDNGWIENFIWLESTRNKNYGKDYTIKELNELSKQCVNRRELKEKYYHAWKYAKKNELIQKLEFKPILGVETYKRYLKDGSEVIVRKPININKSRVIPKKWTYEKCVEESKKYERYNDFMTKSSSAYVTAKYRGWIKDFIWLKRVRKEPNYWTEEKCYDEAKKYNKIEDFILHSNTAYNKSRKKGWYKKYTWLESNPIGQEEFLTYDVCYNEAKKYEYMCEFREKSNSIYSKSCKKGWIKDFLWLKKTHSFLECFFEKNLIKNKIKYEFQKTFPWLKMNGQQYLDFYLPDYNIAIECQGRQHFDKSYNSGFGDGYELILKRDENKYELCEKHGVKVIYYSSVKYETNHHVYTDIKKLFITELKINFEYYDYDEVILMETPRVMSKEHKKEKYKVGCDIIQKTIDGKEIKRWKHINEICDFYKCSRSCIIQAIKGINHTGKGFIWECDLSSGKYVYEINENGNILHKFDTPEEASRFYNICNVSIRERCDKKNLKPFKGHIFTYNPNDFNKDDFLKLDKTEQKPSGYWTYERCYEEAKKYKTFTEFQRKCSGGCSKAHKMGWLKEWGLFKTNEKITFERCVKEASKYNRIEDFKNEKAHLYDAMLKNGWVREIFKYNGKKMKS